MNRKMIICFILSLLVNSSAMATNVNPKLAKIEQLLDICIYSSLHTPRSKDCGKSGLPVIDDNPKEIELLWEYAEIVRRKIGNAPSLEYYELALSRHYSKEKCIDDGLDKAVNWGLVQPTPKNGKEVQHTLGIVFEQCWKEWRDDIVTLAQHNKNDNWLKNVCVGLKRIEQQKVIDACN